MHRDIKPGNIMLGEHGEVHIIDWGIARLVAAGTDDATLHTCAGVLIGTPGYLAPEQAIDAAAVDGKADVYALGAVLFEILTGEPLHPPDRRDALRSTLAGIDGSPSCRRPDREIPFELDLLCQEALAIDPRHRPSARGFADRLRAFTDGDRDLARRHRLASEHLEQARQADRAGDPVRTLREAGRALALDPCCTPAADLLTRLMLQPRLAASTLNLHEHHGALPAVATILLATILTMTFAAACGGLLGAAVSCAIVLGATLLFVAAWSNSGRPSS